MNTRTITIEDTPELTLADYKSNDIGIADVLRFKPDRIYFGVTKDQGSYKFINHAVRGFPKSIAAHRASKPSKRKAAIGAIQKLALKACKARAGTIETIHAGNSIAIFAGDTSTGKLQQIAALKFASKDNRGFADLFEPPVRTDDQNLMIDATELPNEAKAVVVDYLLKANNS